MKLYTILLFIILTISCNESANKVDTTDSAIANIDSLAIQPETADLSGERCYQYISGKDSVSLAIKINNSKVTGDLLYSFHEKDKNTGTIKGQLMGDTLLADYRFNSEGKESLREVAFLLGDSTAREGYAEMIEEKNKMVFKNPASIRFDRSFEMVKIPCDHE